MRVFFLMILTSVVVAASHHPQEFLAEIAGHDDEGVQIVSHFCATCHAPQPLILLGAPRIGYEKDWQPRLKQGLETLLQHTEEGLGAMPARGGCFECSDEQLVLAIKAMVDINNQDIFKKIKKIKKN